MNAPISRRTVLQGIALGVTSPVWLRLAEAGAASASTTNANNHLLVVFLRGGNDALHTVAPIGDAALTKLRPTVAMRDTDMFPMGNGYGMTKATPTLFDFWRAGQLAVVQQVGPTVIDFSHSASARKWETGDPNDRFSSGWLGRYLDATTARGPVRAAAFGESVPLSLISDRSDALSLMSIRDFAFNDAKTPDVAARRATLARFAHSAAPHGSVRETMVRAQQELLSVADPLAKVSAPSSGPTPTAADDVAELFAAGLGTEIGFVSLPSFDTHTDERVGHGRAIAALDELIKNFFARATNLGVRDQSVVLVVSEFGRRVYENQSGGSDHGEATTVLALGAPIVGGMYGPRFDSSQLDNGNLPTRVDLRSVYASVLGGWLHTDPAPILGGAFPTIPLFR